MSQRYLGGVITANPTTPTLASLSGVWTLEQQFQNFNVWSPEIVGNSVRLRSSASAYFNRTPASASNRRTWTWSGWVKRGVLGSSRTLFNGTAASASGTGTVIRFDSTYSNNTIHVFDFNSGGFTYEAYTAAVFRDPSAWYHIVVAYDSTQATSTNRIKIYVNGVQQTLTGSYPSQNYDSFVNSTNPQYVGAENYGNAVITTTTFDGYLAEINFIDGQSLTPSSFGAFDSTGVWQPLPYTGTYGTNGFYLTFSDNSAATAAALGKDTSGNGNNWTPNNISLTAGTTYDWMLDSPTNWIGAAGGNGVGNYATLNPIQNPPSGAVSTAYSNGNLQTVLDSSVARSTFAPASGKWYAEFVITSATLSTDTRFAVEPSSGNTFSGNAGQGRAYSANGNKVFNGTSTAYGSTWTQNDVIGCALDLDNGKVWWSKNGTWQASGDPAAGTNEAFSGLSGEFYFTIVNGNSAVSKTFVANFGQRPFTYTPPTGFKALNTLNLPTPTIMRGDAYFNVNLWTGDQTARTITNSGAMQPDFLWTKSRSNVEDHRLSDSVRGGNGTVLGTLASNTAGAEAFDTDVTGFTSTGFNIRAGTNSPNVTGRTYVGWQWQAGKGVTSSNANGTITSTVSVNTTAGFSVVSYTGNGSASATVGHGLGVAPAMVIVKSRGSTASWIVKHKNLSSNNVLFLEATNAQLSPSNGYVQDLSSSTTFGIVNGGGGVANVNTSSTAYIAYCFAAVTGYSAFGTYTGNGSTDGPFIYLGFRPRFVLIKISSGTTDDWYIFDSARDTTNVVGNYLRPNVSTAEGTFGSLDFTSNGFKVRQSGAALNGSTYTYIYACFAENPFNISRAR